MNTVTATRSNVNREELELKVKKMYREVALHPEVTYHFEMGRALAERLGYPSQILDNIPSSAIDSFAGVGYYFDFALLQEGEKVVDLGSGSGMDVFFAALQVGDRGEVIGVDMTTEQLNKAEGLSRQYNFKQVVFRNSYIESIPVVSGSIDAVISNGVINLSSEKTKSAITVYINNHIVLKISGSRKTGFEVVFRKRANRRVPNMNWES